MNSIRKEEFEKRETNLWNIRRKKECLLIGSDKIEEFLDLYNEAEQYLRQLEYTEGIYSAYKRREHLSQVYCERDKEYEKAKGKRSLLAFLGFTAAYYWLFWQISKPTGLGMILIILPAFFGAGIHFWINAAIFSWLSQKGKEEYQHLDFLKKEIQELDAEIAGNSNPTRQKMDQLNQKYEDAIQRLENFPIN